MRSTRCSAVFAVACLFTLGCIDDTLSPPASAGVYSLRSRNGVAVPVLIGTAASGSTSLEGGSLRLDRDRSFTIRYDEGVIEGPVTTYYMTIVIGTYVERGGRVVLTPWGGGPITALRDGDAITLPDRDAQLVFRR